MGIYHEDSGKKGLDCSYCVTLLDWLKILNDDFSQLIENLLNSGIPGNAVE